MPPGSVDLDLVEDREGDPVAVLAERADLVGAARLLPPELVAGERQDGEPPPGEPILQPLEAGVLRREPALRRGVDDQQGLALVGVQVGRVSAQGGDGAS